MGEQLTEGNFESGVFDSLTLTSGSIVSASAYTNVHPSSCHISGGQVFSIADSYGTGTGDSPYSQQYMVCLTGTHFGYIVALCFYS